MLIRYILDLEIFLDKWLLCVHGEGAISVWDVGTYDRIRGERERSPATLCMSHERLRVSGEMGWSSCVAAVDASEQAILLACSKNNG
jgi:hypothetical protein